MRQNFSLACLGLVLACGSDDTVKDDLIGTWLAELGALEAVAYTFNDDGAFEIDFFSATGSQIQLEAHVGTYELRNGANGLADANGDHLFCSVAAEDSTCGTTWQVEYSVDFVGETLRLVNEQGGVLLEPVPDTEDPASGVITFGCFTDTGFRPSSATFCEPGEPRACAIVGQTCEAIHECNSAGSAYGPCVCP
jgi:hypothetical protein